MYTYAHYLFRLLFLSIISTAYHLISGSRAARLLLNWLIDWSTRLTKHTAMTGRWTFTRVRVGRECMGTPFPFFLKCMKAIEIEGIAFTCMSILCPKYKLRVCLTADSDICVYVHDIMDDTSAMWDNWPIGSWHTKLLFDCFTRLILTRKQAPRMHQNAPLPDKKIKKIFGGRGTATSPDPSLLGRGYPLPRPHSPRRLRRSAFPFLFIYDSNTALDNSTPQWQRITNTQ